MITVSAVFLLILLLSYACPLITDDLHFKYVWNGFDADIGKEVRVSSISDIFTSAHNYYLYSGGRVICHFIVFAMVNLNKWVFAVCNAIVFAVSGLLIWMHMKEMFRQMNRFTLALIYLTMFLLLPVWGDSVLWISGSVNYMWAGCAMLWAIFLIDREDSGAGNHILTCIAVLIASATNEIFGGMLAIILILRMITNRIKPLRYYITSLFCVLPGIALVISAPGNANRQQIIDGHQSVGLADVLKTSYGYLASFIDWGSIILWVISAVLFYKILKKRPLKEIITSMTITIACFAGSVALGFSGVVIQRALFSVLLPLLVPFWSLLYYLLYKMESVVRFKAIVCAFIAIALLNVITLRFFQAAIFGLLLLIIVLIRIVYKNSFEKPLVPSVKESLILITIMTALVIMGCVTFFMDVRKYNERMDTMVQAMRDNDGGTLSSMGRLEMGPGSFFPAEGTIVSDYLYSWVYQYYVTDGER